MKETQVETEKWWCSCIHRVDKQEQSTEACIAVAEEIDSDGWNAVGTNRPRVIVSGPGFLSDAMWVWGWRQLVEVYEGRDE